MSEHQRNKAGLNKKISSVFKGIPIPQTDGGQEPSGTPALERTGYAESKSPVQAAKTIAAVKAEAEEKVRSYAAALAQAEEKLTEAKEKARAEAIARAKAEENLKPNNAN